MLLYCKYHFPNLLLWYFQFPASFKSKKDKLSVFIFKAHQDYFYLIPLLQYQEGGSGFDQHLMPASIIQSLNFQTTLNIFSSAASHGLVDFFTNRIVHYLPFNLFLKVLSNPTRQQLYCRHINVNAYHSSTVSLHLDSAIVPLLSLYVEFKHIYILLCFVHDPV